MFVILRACVLYLANSIRIKIRTSVELSTWIFCRNFSALIDFNHSYSIDLHLDFIISPVSFYSHVESIIFRAVERRIYSVVYCATMMAISILDFFRLQDVFRWWAVLVELAANSRKS